MYLSNVLLESGVLNPHRNVSIKWGKRQFAFIYKADTNKYTSYLFISTSFTRSCAVAYLQPDCDGTSLLSDRTWPLAFTKSCTVLAWQLSTDSVRHVLSLGWERESARDSPDRTNSWQGGFPPCCLLFTVSSKIVSLWGYKLFVQRLSLWGLLFEACNVYLMFSGLRARRPRGWQTHQDKARKLLQLMRSW